MKIKVYRLIVFFFSFEIACYQDPILMVKLIYGDICLVGFKVGNIV